MRESPRKRRRFQSEIARRILNGCFGLVCSVALSSWAYGSDIDVNRVEDSGVGSLRQGLSAVVSGDRLVFQPILNGTTLSNTNGSLTLNVPATLLDANTITVTDDHAFKLAAPLTVDWAGTLTLNGILSDGVAAGSLVKTGLGTLVLTSANSFTGGVTAIGGTLQVSNSKALGSGTLTIKNTVGTPTLALGDGLNIKNAIALQSQLNISSAIGTTNTLSGVISGAAAADKLNTLGNGTLILSGTNTFIGGVNVTDASTLVLKSSAALGTGTLTNASALTLDLTSGITVANKVTLGSNLTANVDSGTATMSGAIGQSAVSQLTKTGAGILALTGTNTYTGGTIVSAGTLEGNSSSLQGNITDNAKLIFNQPGTGTYAGTISGTGTVEKIGNGTLIFSGTDTLTSTLQVKVGELQVNGSIAGPVNVLSTAASLTGIGAVGDVTNSGYVQPATTATIGNLTVNGNFKQTSLGTTEIKANAAGNVPGVNNDHLTITGQANLGGTLTVIPISGGIFNPLTQYTILNAAGGVSGQYAQAASLDPAFGVVVTYNANDVMFNLQPTTSLFGAAQTENQAAVGASLDALSLTASGPLYTMINQLGIQSPAAQRAAMDQLSGSVYGNLQTIGLQIGSQFQQNITNTLVANCGFLTGGDACPGQPCEYALGRGWFQGFGGNGNLRGDGNAAGANYNQGGGILGIDGGVDETGRMGLAAGISNTGYHDGSGAGGQITSYQIGGYGIKHDDVTYILATGNYGYNANSTTRNLNAGGLNQSLHADYFGSGAGASIEAGVFLTAIGPVQVQPLVGLQYLFLQQQGFEESGGPAALKVANQSANSLRANAGARFVLNPWTGPNGTTYTAFTTVRFMGELLDNDRLVNASFTGAPAGGAFTTHGTKIGRNYGTLGQGLEVRLTELWSLIGSADVMTGGNITIASGSIASMTRW